MKRFFILALVLVSSGCANKKHTAVVIDNALYEALNDTFNLEQALLKSNTPQWDLAKSQAFNKKLLPAVSAGREFNRIIANWQTGQPMPVELHDAIASVTDALKQVTTDMPDGTTKTKILENLGNAEAIILNALNIVFTLKGA